MNVHNVVLHFSKAVLSPGGRVELAARAGTFTYDSCSDCPTEYCSIKPELGCARGPLTPSRARLELFGCLVLHRR